MGKRLLFGPIIILFLLLGVWADQWLDAQNLPDFLRGYRILPNPTFPPGTVILPVITAIAIFAARELHLILTLNGITASKRIMTFAAALGLAVSCLVPSSTRAPDAVALVSGAAALVLAVAMVFHSRHRSVEGVVAATGGALLSFVYLGLMFGFLLAIRREYTAWTLLYVILVTKSCDIGAYFTGKAIGRHKLIPWLSPGKTWEGLVGGVVLSSLVGVGGLWVLREHFGIATPVLWSGIIPGILFGLVGQVGDLIESVFKRDAGTKDSGKLLPGFGGVLDVLDSPLLVAPLAYWWLGLAFIDQTAPL